jgi:MFS transporter, CP family, cyanate transporter
MMRHRDPVRVAAAEAAGRVPWLMAALFLVALSLRPQLVGLAPLVPEIERDLAMSHTVAGLLGTIPVLCMGIFAPVAPFLAARLGTTRTIAAAVSAIGIFGILRGFADGPLQVIGLTIGVGVGMGLAGALLPVAVKEQLPEQPLAATASYSTGLQLGSAVSAAVAVPLAVAVGTWRGSLLAFSLLTLVMVLPWIVINARRRISAEPLRLDRRGFLDPAAWLLALAFGLYGAVYYGLISWLPDAYREIGWSAEAGGALVGLLNAAAIAGAFSVAILAARARRYTLILLGAAVIFVAATAGLAYLPNAAPIMALLAGYANGALFPLLLALPLRQATSPAQVAVVSSVMLGAGYTLAAVSPVGLGAVRDLSGSFQASLGTIALLAVAFVVVLAVSARQAGRRGAKAAPVAAHHGGSP